MAVVTDTWLADCLLLVLSLLALFYWYVTNTANYFRDRGIPYLPQFPILGCKQVFTLSQYDQSQFFYKAFPQERYFGYFQTRIPILLVRDPEMIERIFVKDFAHFLDRGFAIAEHDTLNQNLSNLKGHKWRSLRNKLTPTFSSGKLKQMFDQLDKCSENLLIDLESIADCREPTNSHSFMAGFTSEVIGTTAFGLDFKRNSPQAIEFNDKFKGLFDFNLKRIPIFFFMMIFPKVLNFLKISMTPVDVKNYFVNLVKANKTYRKSNNVKRNDYFQLLLTLQEETEKNEVPVVKPGTEKYEEDALIDLMEYIPQDSNKSTSSTSTVLTDESLAAQSYVFLTAGTESVSTTLSFVLYHTGKDLSVQRKLQEEVDSVLTKHGKCTYEAVKEMTYLDQVIQEAMRMYPVLALTLRECTMSYNIPDSDKVIEKGTIVAVPVVGLQMDPNFHPNPEIFDPDRFIDNNFKPSPTFMPFGDGPRICIGMRFAILEMKVCLCKLFSKYSVEVNSKTKEPFVFEAKSFFPKPEGGIWLNFKKRL